MNIGFFGEISVESQVDKETCFTIILKLSKKLPLKVTSQKRYYTTKNENVHDMAHLFCGWMRKVNQLNSLGTELCRRKDTKDLGYIIATLKRKNK